MAASARPQAVLFVCAHNQIRSPMAAAIAKFMFKSLYIASAGIRKGESDPFMIAVMEEIGIDLSKHKPRTLAELEEYEGLNFDLVVSLSPEAHHRALDLPRTLAVRLAREKAVKVQERVRLQDEIKDSYILAADTVVALGRRILPKPELLEEASSCLRLLSGRTHKVYSGLCVITPKDSVKTRLVETRVRFKRLSDQEIENYLGSGEWRQKAGGYAIQGLAGSFVVKLIGSYTNVVGLPLYESTALLGGEGFPVLFGWVNRA
jgi:septum formation protein